MEFDNFIQRKNSVLFDLNSQSILYEKLLNTIHTGERKKLKSLQNKIEKIEYHPIFETESLKQKKDEGIENLVFNVTEDCNFNCTYCIYSEIYDNERIKNNSNMDFDIAKKTIDLLIRKTKNPLLISFYGGEPLNNMKLINKIINYATKKYSNKLYAFSMTSNFYNADKYLEDLIKNEIHINISLDGPKEIHDKFRKTESGKLTYKKIIRNIEKFKEFNPKYAKEHFRFNVTCYDPTDLPKIIDFFQKNNDFQSARISMIEQKGLKIKINYPEEYFQDLIFKYTNSILQERDPKILRGFFDRNLKRIIFRNKSIMPNNLPLDGCCYPGNRKLFVDTDGTFYMCERFGKRLPIGNTQKGINQGLIENAIDCFCNIRNELCPNCWAQRLCNPCIQSAKDPKKEISKEGLAFLCDSNKYQILIAIVQYTHLLQNKKTLKKYINTINF